MNDLSGTWKLVNTRAWDDNNNVLPRPFGPEPHGLVVFHDNQRMMCVLTDGRVALPEGEVRPYSSYMGRFEVQGDTLTTRVDGSVDADRLGGDKVRKFRFENNRLILKPPPRANYGTIEHRELEWERIA